MSRVRLCAILFLLTGAVFAESHLKSIKIAVSNPTDLDRPAEDIVIPFSDLRPLAPNLRAGSLIVTATDASTMEEDAAAIRSTEIPSQVDDLDGDYKADELAFQLDLKPHQTRIVTITYGPPDHIYRLRGEYPARTYAYFTKKFDGMGWESERNAFRLYFDKRNAIDLYGKTRPSLQLQRFATPEYIYHNASPDGRD